jgi:hypothetical protein
VYIRYYWNLELERLQYKNPDHAVIKFTRVNVLPTEVTKSS